MANKKASNLLNEYFSADEIEEALEAGKPLKPLEEGWYDVTILSAIKRVNTNEASSYHGKENLELTVMVDEPGRKISFVRVPLYKRFAPTQKNPSGSPTGLVGFLKAFDLINKDGGVSLSDWEDLEGETAQAFVSQGKPNDKGVIFNEIAPLAGRWRSLKEAEASKEEETAEEEAEEYTGF